MGLDKILFAPDENGMVGSGVKFERIRRIALLSMPVSQQAGNGHGALRRLSVATGYLVGTMDRWNDAKRSEERDRVIHFSSSGASICHGDKERE